MGNLIDKAVNYLAPQKALERARARNQLQRIESPQARDAQRVLLDRIADIARGFDGARDDRMTAGWRPGNQSLDLQLRHDGNTLRDRATDLIKNNPFARSAVNTIVSNVVGTGIKPSPRIADRRRRKLIRDAWNYWTENEADITGHQHYYEMQGLSLRECVRAGEHLLAFRYLTQRERNRLGRRTPLAIQFIEAERIANDSMLFTPVGINPETGNKIRDGVEIDQYGREVAFWVYPNRPNDLTPGFLKPERHEAGHRIRHIFLREQIGQYRGYTWMATAISWLYKLGVYTDNELMTSSLSACVMLIVKTLDGGDEDFGASVSGRDSTDKSGNRLEHMTPGLIPRLAPGEDVEAFNPQRPNNAADAWISLILRSIGIAMDLGYEPLSRDHSKTTFSSGRNGEIEDKRRYNQVAHFLKWREVKPVWEEFVRMNVLMGTEGFPSAEEFVSNYDEWVNCDYIGDGRDWVDPQKDQTAADAAIAANQDTLSRVVSMRTGQDYADVLEQRAIEKTVIKELEAEYDVTLADQPNELATKQLDVQQQQVDQQDNSGDSAQSK